VLAIVQRDPVVAQSSLIEIAQKAKSATALVQLDGKARGTAFCIHPAGYYVTNYHVVDGKYKALKLILHPGREEEQIFDATVVRKDSEADLATIKVAQDGAKVLPLGTDDALQEAMGVLALGFPFGDGLALEEGQNPGVSINSGKISSMRMKDGVLQEIQFDALVNPGNSGGPLLLDDGSVVGVVRSGIPATGINFAVPVHELRAFLAPPEIAIERVESIPWDARYDAYPFLVRIADLDGVTGTYRAELVVDNGVGQRTIDLEAQPDGSFSAKLPALEAVEPGTVEARMTFQDSTFVGALTITELAVDGRVIPIEDVDRFVRTPEMKMYLQSGEVLSLAAEPGGTAYMQLAGEKIPVQMADLSDFDVIEPKIASALKVEVNIYEGTERVQQRAESIPWSGRPGQVESPPAAATQDAPTVASNPTAPMPETPPAKSAVTPTSSVWDFPPVTKPELKAAEGLTAAMMERVLPSEIAALALGGGGRYLFLTLPKARQLAIFDINVGDVAKYLPLPSDSTMVAAGADYFFLLDPTKKVISRYSLASFERELTQLIPIDGEILEIDMGYGSNGPLLLQTPSGAHGGSKFTMLNVNNLKDTRDFKAGRLQISNKAITSVSADGLTLGLTGDGSSSPSGLEVMIISRDGERSTYEHTSPGHALIGPTGQFVYTWQGIYTTNLKPLFQDQKSLIVIPTTSANYHIGISNRGGEGKAPAASLYLTQEKNPLAFLPELTELAIAGSTPHPASRMETWRILYVPQASTLITIPETNDRLCLRRLNVEEQLQEAGVDYLVVTSSPGTLAQPGQHFEYQLEVLSKHGGLTYTLESGAPGMVISDTGLLTWDVPQDQQEEVAVLIRIKDASGQEVYHTCVLSTPTKQEPAAP
jgi:S1-C subfamily serine protease